MNTIKKSIFAITIFILGFANAQNSDMNNILKVGVSGGIAAPSENASSAVGADIAYQNIITPGFALGIATGYTQYFGKENNGLNNNDFGVVPVAALLRVYPKQTGFYFGSDLGYGFITGSKKVASNSIVERPDGGFYIKPEIGYHNKDWNFDVHYQRIFTGSTGEIGDQKYTAGNIGVGISYNIPLGK